MKTTKAVGDELMSHSRLADALIEAWTLPEIGYHLVVLQLLLSLHRRRRHHPDRSMLRYYEIRNEKLTILNENGYMKLMGVYAIGMGDSADGVLVIFALGKREYFWDMH
jgi:hypothetical protein